MSTIPLDAGKGLDPHMISCTRCGEQYGLTIGALRQATDSNGVTHYCQKGETSRHPHRGVTNWTPVKEGTVIPSGLCTACTEELKRFEQEVANGGIFFKCRCCTTTGVIKGHSPLAQTVRKQMNIHAPEPCGVEFENCEEHTPDGSIDA